MHSAFASIFEDGVALPKLCRMQLEIQLALALFMAASFLPTACAAEPGLAALEQQYDTMVRPFLNAHCLACHDEDTAEGALNLSAFKTIDDVTHGHRRWELVLERLEA